MVRQFDESGHASSWTAAGPFLFGQPGRDGDWMSGLRPFWVERHNAAGDFRAGYFLYPLFSYSVDENTYKWSVFEIIRRTGRRARAAAPQTIFDPRGEFEIFPFWFSRVTGDSELSYRALFPVAGTIKNKLGFERLSWVLFPLYAQNEKRGAITTYTPWPVVRITRGAAHGWGIWPLFNYVDRPGVSRAEYYLWPLGYNVTKQPHPDDPGGTAPRRDIGALPFWARSTGPGFINESYAWPFFGYTDVTAPEAYHETRYFWPFFVQGGGENRMINRWAPFYTHSLKKGYEKEWFAWPLLRQGRWNDGKISRRRTQVLFFAYWSETQRALDRPNAPEATLTHLWPFFSTWDNGAGARQWQFFSPLDVFFPGNDKVRHTWSPFFSLVRFSQAPSGNVRATAFWNAITWETNQQETRSEFHLGPLLSVASRGANRRIAIGNGLFGFRHDGSRWRSFWLDFRPNSATTLPASR